MVYHHNKKGQYEEITQILKNQNIVFKRSGDINDNSNSRPTSLRDNRIVFDWPPVSDYIEMRKMKDRARNDMALEKFNNNTSVTKKLSQNINCWKNWPPSWIDGRRMLMLSGMVTDNQGRLIKGTV